jgi:hypothetical protein
MKTFKKDEVKRRSREMLNNEHDKVSRGAEYINKIITFAHGNDWRRKKNVKKHSK